MLCKLIASQPRKSEISFRGWSVQLTSRSSRLEMRSKTSSASRGDGGKCGSGNERLTLAFNSAVMNLRSTKTRCGCCYYAIELGNVSLTGFRSSQLLCLRRVESSRGSLWLQKMGDDLSEPPNQCFRSGVRQWDR